MYTKPFREYLIGNLSLWGVRENTGSWEIADGQLFLISLNVTLFNGAEATLSTVFPNASDRVLAYWYSGTLQIRQRFEYDLLFEVLRGDVVATRLQHNKLTPVIDVDEIPF